MNIQTWRRFWVQEKPAAWLGGAALGVLAAVSLLPLLVEPMPVGFVRPWGSLLAERTSELLVVALMLSAVVLGARPAERRERVMLVLIAGFMTLVHWYLVDLREKTNPATGRPELFNQQWQQHVYISTLNHQLDAIPHVLRPLPYGFVRALEWLTGNWFFACITYRWFFTFWFLWFYDRFVRKFRDARGALLCLTIYVALYPLSIWLYNGQLTDSMSHALFALALIYLIEDRWIALTVVLALGVLAKETVVIVVPAYLACHWRRGFPALLKTIAMGVACAAAFLAARLPLGWSFTSHKSLNNSEIMVWFNLGYGAPGSYAVAMRGQNYIHFFVFVGVFLPFVLYEWRRTDRRLKALFLVLTPLLVVSQLFFGWLYESRNFVPLLPVLTAIAVGSATAVSGPMETNVASRLQESHGPA